MACSCRTAGRDSGCWRDLPAWRSWPWHVWLARGVTNKLVAVSLGLVMGGAAGNAIDRVALGGVADFFSLHAFGFYWYVFNLADVAIVAGVVGLLYDFVRTEFAMMPQRLYKGW